MLVNETDRRLALLPQLGDSGVRRFVIIDLDDIISFEDFNRNIVDEKAGSEVSEADLEAAAGRKVK